MEFNIGDKVRIVDSQTEDGWPAEEYRHPDREHEITAGIGDVYFDSYQIHEPISGHKEIGHPDNLVLVEAAEPTFETGETVEVRNDGADWDGSKGIYLCPDLKGGHWCVDSDHEEWFQGKKPATAFHWDYVRKPQGNISLTLTVNGVEKPLSSFSKEELLKLWKEQQ